MSNPLVSVVIPTFNSGHLLKEAVDSVLSQTFTDYEIIVVDDGSTDETREIVAHYEDRVRYYYQENRGSAAARQAGVDLSQGKYIAALDADDLWLPTKLECQVSAIENYKEAGLCYCDGYRWKEGTPLLESPLLSSLYGKGFTGWQFSYFFKVNCAATSSMVFLDSALKRVGGYNTSLRWGDFEVCARLLAFYPAVYVNEPLMAYRVHRSNSSSLTTSENVVSSLNFKRTTRISVLASLPKDKGDRSISIFRRSPAWFQFCMLLWWRLSYGSSRTKVIRDVFHYGTRMAQRLVGVRGKRSLDSSGEDV